MSILYEQHERLVEITIDRPDALNALNWATHGDLCDAWRRFRDDDEAWVAIITGAGEKAFCTGADLKDWAQDDLPGAVVQHRDELQPGFGGITRNLEVGKPVIAAINGYCLGGGLEIALACDLRVAGEGASFGLPEGRWGLLPGGGGTQRLPRMIPPGKAMELILTGQRMSAGEALQFGLVNRVVPPQDILPTARELATAILKMGPLAVRAARTAVRRGLEMDLADGLRLENHLATLLWPTEDCAEGRRAFAEKRAPIYRAR